MRKLQVRHQRLPGIGERFDFEATCGLIITIVSHRSGRRDVAILETDTDEPLATVALTRAEAEAMAALLVGAQIELVP